MDTEATVPEARIAEARLAASAAAIAGDPGTLYHLVSRLMGEGMPFDVVLFDVLAPLQRDVGARWQAGSYMVSEEHAATATVETVVSLLAGSFDQPADGRHVVVAAAEGDQHSLPGRLIAAHLAYMGYRVTFLGANVLATDLREYLEVEKPDALVVSSAMSGHLLGARATVQAGHAAGTPVIVGGRGFGKAGEWAESIGADAWAADLRQVAEILGSWSPDPGAAESVAMDPSLELAELSGRRDAVLGAAQGLLADRSILLDARARDELSILLSAVEASLLVGDDGPAIDILAWQATTLAAHQLVLAEAVAAALETALEVNHPTAASVLARSRVQIERGLASPPR
jgi:methanogenic corrinoid protein MtbC1